MIALVTTLVTASLLRPRLRPALDHDPENPLHKSQIAYSVRRPTPTASGPPIQCHWQIITGSTQVMCDTKNSRQGWGNGKMHRHRGCA
ncbi:hypothetical protein EDB84DRAFT_695462 [Lactarius hengduanensis]|nr:hypothetical protein EDB84DRAFT_695462 [Lactarius hengduanensis]